MNVKELIERLEHFSPDLDVVLYTKGAFFYKTSDIVNIQSHQEDWDYWATTPTKVEIWGK